MKRQNMQKRPKRLHRRQWPYPPLPPRTMWSGEIIDRGPGYLVVKVDGRLWCVDDLSGRSG